MFFAVEHIAATRAGIDGWQAYRFEVADGGYIVTGCVPDGVYRSGPRKGRPRYDKPVEGTVKTLVVSLVEKEQAESEYESATGKCWACEGSGKTLAGVVGGVRQYRKCRRCGRVSGGC